MMPFETSANHCMSSSENPIKNPILRFTLIVSIGLLPLLVGIGLFGVMMNANLSATTPTWSDEIYYWHQALTFREAGFQGGYYTVNEQPAPAAFTRYYAWGAAVPLVYGLQGRLFGWSLYAIPLLNMGLFSAAVMLFLWSIQATRWQLIFTALLIVTFAPFLLFSASSMLEVQQQAIAILLATAFYRLLQRRLLGQTGWRWQWGLLLALMVLAILLRPTWAILFVPFAILALRTPSFKNGFWATILGGGLFIFSAWLTQLMAAPDVKFVQSLLEVVRHFPLGSIPILGLKITNNIQAGLAGHPLEIHNRAMLFLFIGLLLAAWLWQKNRKNNSPIATSALSQQEVLLHLYNIGVILVFNLILYDIFDWRDYRVTTPHLLMSLFLLVACRRYRLVGVMIVALALVLPIIPATYRSPEWYGNHVNHDRDTAIDAWSEQLMSVMSYDATTTSPWCNTVLHTPYFLFVPIEVLLAVPPGIGVSAILDEDSLQFPLKSRYLFLEDDFYQRYADKLHLEPLLPVPNGMLWLNKDAACEPNE